MKSMNFANSIFEKNGALISVLLSIYLAGCSDAVHSITANGLQRMGTNPHPLTTEHDTTTGLQNEDTPSLPSEPHQAREVLNNSIQNALSELNDFDRNSIQLSNRTADELKLRMDSILAQLDALAVESHVDSAQLILESISSAQKNTYNTAALARDSAQKGLWLSWAEKLLLTQNALQHFFSELRLQQFEKAMDSGDKSALDVVQPELKKLIHRDHERRLISILKRQQKSSDEYRMVLELLASSGGTLSRLFIYQRFITEPDEQLAETIAQIGLPRIADLLGESSNLTSGLPLVPVTRTGAHESQLPRLFGDLKSQWKALKEYFEDIQKIPARYERASRMWQEMHEQVEFLINILSADDSKKAILRKNILQSFRSSADPADFTYRRGGIEFQEGDILLLQSGPISGLWESFTESGAHLSHLLMVTFADNGLPYAVEMNFGKLMISPLDLQADRYTVVRPRNLSAQQKAAIRATIAAALKQNLSYDFKFNSETQDSLYCSELAAAIYKNAGITLAPVQFKAASRRARKILYSAGVLYPSFFAQGSYLASGDFEVVGQHINSDPKDFIRGQFVMDAFTQYVATADHVRLYKHSESHQLWTLAALAQTTGAELRRALGPQNFLYTVMTLDKLVHSIESDAFKVQQQVESGLTQQSRITALKSALQQSLQDVVPKHLAPVFPNPE